MRLTMTEAALLAFVDDHGALTQRELADLLHISRASTGTIIDALAGRELLTRNANPNDRRVWAIELTISGRQCVAEFRTIDYRVRQLLRTGFDREERHLLADPLQRLEDNATHAR